jgi:hypothetical protein
MVTPVKKEKLKIGLMLEDWMISAWSHKMIENIIKSDYAKISLVVLGNKKVHFHESTFIVKLKESIYNKISFGLKNILMSIEQNLIDRDISFLDADRHIDSSGMLTEFPVLTVQADMVGSSSYFIEADIQAIRDYDVDVLIRLGFGVLRGDILNAAKHGVWSFHHGDNRTNRGGPAGFWESMESSSQVGSVLQILTEDLGNGKVLYRSYSCTDNMSIRKNNSNNYWKSLSFMTRKLKELYILGDDAFIKKVESENSQPVLYSERHYIEPSNLKRAFLLLIKIGEKIKKMYMDNMYIDQWIIMFHLCPNFSSSLWRYKKIFPPKDRFWADPHVIFRDGKYYIFIEEFKFDKGKGRIAMFVLDEAGNYGESRVILEKSYHLSYPFVFEYQNDIYMVPESEENQTVELYKCTEFPDKWEFQINLLEGVNAVDSTLYFHENKWWMFTNIVENEGASTWDELYLFYSDDLFSNNWKSHPLNPVVSDCKTSRPAGEIFVMDGRIFRPSQNSSNRYGYGFNINEITKLDEKQFSEELVSSVKPNWDKDIIGTHTFNRVKDLHLIDALCKFSRFRL